MRKELRFSLSILLFALIVGGITYYVRTAISLQLLEPTAEAIGLFDMLLHKKHPNKIVYGFLPNWTLDRTNLIKTSYLTDIAYFGLRIEADGNFQKYVNDYELEPGYNQWKNSENLAKLITKAKRENTRVALTIISHEDSISDAFLACEKCWQNLLVNTISELKQHSIKDVNLNFEYTTYTTEQNAQQYTKFSKFMNEGLDKEFGDSRVIVSVFADSLTKPRVTNAPELAKVTDGLFIMAYDFHRPDSDQAGPVAPIGGKGKFAEYDIETMIKDYTSVIPAEKLILGVPYYGYNWVTESQSEYSARIPGNDWIGYSQSQTYETIMDLVTENNIETKWDDLAKSPYFFYISPTSGMNRTVYFENVESLQFKYRLAKQHNFGGVGIWALGYDGARKELWELIREEFIDL